jgi:hypothetical protein
MNSTNNSVTPDDHFTICEYEVISPKATTPEKNPLNKFSLRGKSAEIAKEIVMAVFVLFGIAFTGQLTVLYAPPNTGKTLFTLYLLIKSIMEGQVDSDKVYYLDMDDTESGLYEKLLLAEKYGFHLLAESYENFSAPKFLYAINEIIKSGKARGRIIILDTLKKFTDLMDKRPVLNLQKFFAP